MEYKKLLLHTDENLEIKTNIKIKRGLEEEYKTPLHFKEFPQGGSDKEFGSRFIAHGLLNMKPSYDPEKIYRRHEIIKIFLKDYFSKKELLRPLQIMHLANIVYNHKNEIKDIDHNRKILERMHFESKLFLENLKKFHPEIAENYFENISHNTIETTLQAAEQGKFNFLFTSLSSSGTHEIFGSMDSKLKFKEIKPFSFSKEYVNLNKTLIKDTLIHEVYGLNDIIGVFGALYAEALEVFYRKQKGLPFCFVNIDENQTFEIKNAEPLIEVVGNPVNTSIKSEGEKIRIILSGLHSGGKSILLQNIPEYILQGLSGRVLPSESATIPLLEEIIYSLEIKKEHYVKDSGKLERELNERIYTMKKLNPRKMYVCDEFLQHASPDAAEYLEPVILKEIENTGAASIIVTHRGEFIDEKIWQYYHPDFEMKEDKVFPKYTFSKGKPDEEIMKKHAIQLLEKIVSEENSKSNEESSPLGGTLHKDYKQENELRQNNRLKFLNIINSGDYLE